MTSLESSIAIPSTARSWGEVVFEIEEVLKLNEDYETSFGLVFNWSK